MIDIGLVLQERTVFADTADFASPLFDGPHHFGLLFQFEVRNLGRKGSPHPEHTMVGDVRSRCLLRLVGDGTLIGGGDVLPKEVHFLLDRMGPGTKLR